MEVIDLSYNKLNDFDEIIELCSSNLRKEIIKIVSVKGNCFYNQNE